MNILITGSSGFLGTAVRDCFLQKKHHLFSIQRPKYDLLNTASLKRLAKALPTIDVIIHLAAQVPRKAIEDTGALFGANMRLTQNLLTVFGQKTKAIVYASTIEVYGRIPRTTRISERTSTHPTTWYGKSKLKSEQLICDMGKRMHIPIAVLRFSPLYGPGDTISRAIPNFIQRALSGEIIETKGGRNRRDYLHKEDAARAILLAVEQNADGIFCIGSGHSITVNKAAHIIRDRINPLLPIYEIPRKEKRQDLVYSIAKARRILGFTPSHIFPDKIAEEIAWWKLRTPQ